MSCIEYKILLNDIKQVYVKYDNDNRKKKTKRDIQLIVFSIILYILLLFIGTLCYVVLFNLDWLNAFYGAVLVATGINIEYDAMTTVQKVFIIIYAILSVIIFLSIANTIIDRLYDMYDTY